MPAHKLPIPRMTTTIRIRSDLLNKLLHKKADREIKSVSDFVNQAVEEKINKDNT